MPRARRILINGGGSPEQGAEEEDGGAGDSAAGAGGGVIGISPGAEEGAKNAAVVQERGKGEDSGAFRATAGGVAEFRGLVDLRATAEGVQEGGEEDGEAESGQEYGDDHKESSCAGGLLSLEDSGGHFQFQELALLNDV